MTRSVFDSAQSCIYVEGGMYSLPLLNKLCINVEACKYLFLFENRYVLFLNMMGQLTVCVCVKLPKIIFSPSESSLFFQKQHE